LRYGIPFSTAAAVLFLVAGWFALGSPSSNALAQVIEATIKHKTARCRFEASAEFKMKWHADREEEFVPAYSDEVAYFDLTSPRVRIERHEKTINDTVQSDWVTVQDSRQDRLLVTSSIQLLVDENDTKDENLAALIKEIKKDVGKTARLFRITGDDTGTQPFPYVKTDKTLLEILRGMQDSKHIVSTKDSLNGRDATKYRLDEVDFTTILWVDAGTKLPVRIEQELLVSKPNVRGRKWVYTNFEWDADVEQLDELFSTKPPAGYEFTDHTRDR